MDIKREMINAHNADKVSCYTVIAEIDGKNVKAVSAIGLRVEDARTKCIEELTAIEAGI